MSDIDHDGHIVEEVTGDIANENSGICYENEKIQKSVVCAYD